MSKHRHQTPAKAGPQAGEERPETTREESVTAPGEAALPKDDTPATIITVTEASGVNIPIRPHSRMSPQPPRQYMPGRVHVYEEGDGSAVSLDLYARVSIEEQNDQSLKLRCEMCSDPAFEDLRTLTVLPPVTIPKALYDEHEGYLVFRMSQSIPWKKEYTFRMNKSTAKPFYQHGTEDAALSLNAELNAAASGDEGKPEDGGTSSAPAAAPQS